MKPKRFDRLKTGLLVQLPDRGWRVIDVAEPGALLRSRPPFPACSTTSPGDRVQLGSG